jgi:hypothetical protein
MDIEVGKRLSFKYIEEVESVLIKVGDQTFTFYVRDNDLAVRVIGGGVRVGSVAHNVMTIHQEFD